MLNRVTLRIDNDDRIALLGANGNGKSTLVKLLANRLAPFSGRITRADKLSIAYFAQHQLDELNEEGSPYDHVRKLMGDAPETKIRGRTGAIGFSGKAGDTPVKSLSGGEKARLLLGLATFFGPNMIILDEPTNHLDIDSRAALAEAINEFPGAVIMVSHDRYLIDACADQLWVVADRAVTPYDGDLDDYRRMVLSSRGMRTSSRDRERGVPATNLAQQERKARAAEAEGFRRRGRDRPHQRHYLENRYRAGAAGYFHARSETGGPTRQGTRRRRDCPATRGGRMAGGEFAIRRSQRLAISRKSVVKKTRQNKRPEPRSDSIRTGLWRFDQLRSGAESQVAAGFFFGFDFTVFGGATGWGARSIALRRPPVKV